MKRRVNALVVFAALTVPFGIAAHLAAELGALGWRDDAHLAFSTLHVYLALLAVGSLGAVLFATSNLRGERRRTAIAELVEALPFRGTGVRFAALSFALQFLFFGVTQLGEGCPFCGGDALVGILAATLASAVGAVAILFGKRRILAIALKLDLAWLVPLDDTVRALSIAIAAAANGATPRRLLVVPCEPTASRC